MDRDIFTSRFSDMSSTRKKEIRDKKEEILKKSIDACPSYVKYMVFMEELAELQQEISKYTRYTEDDIEKIDSYGLLEEMADVALCLEMLQLMTGIDNKMFANAMVVKLEREGIRRGILSEN